MAKLTLLVHTVVRTSCNCVAYMSASVSEWVLCDHLAELLSRLVAWRFPVTALRPRRFPGTALEPGGFQTLCCSLGVF